jgi:hypothetical protein
MPHFSYVSIQSITRLDFQILDGSPTGLRKLGNCVSGQNLAITYFNASTTGLGGIAMSSIGHSRMHPFQRSAWRSTLVFSTSVANRAAKLSTRAPPMDDPSKKNGAWARTLARRCTSNFQWRVYVAAKQPQRTSCSAGTKSSAGAFAFSPSMAVPHLGMISAEMLTRPLATSLRSCAMSSTRC